jgi:hypothetical protein
MFSHKSIYLILTYILVSLCLSSHSNAEEVITVDWYMAPENEAAYKAKLQECRNNPGQLQNTPNCINVANAQHRLFATPRQKTPQQLEEEQQRRAAEQKRLEEEKQQRAAARQKWEAEKPQREAAEKQRWEEMKQRIKAEQQRQRDVAKQKREAGKKP